MKMPATASTVAPKARGRGWRVGRAVGLALVAWALLAWGAARALVVRAELAQADAIVVLSGASVYAERARYAAELYGARRAPRIILTNDNQRGGWSNARQQNPFFFERAGEELQRAGVPAAQIEVLPQPVTNTYDESMLLRDYAAAHGLRSLIFVTSASHSRRALWTLQRVFQGSGVAVGLSPVAPGQQTPAPALWWLHVQGWRLVAGEYAKLLYYWFKYR